MAQAIKRRHLLRAIAAAPGLATPFIACAAAKYPAQPFIILNSSSPGGYLDNLGRAVDPYLSKDLGENFSIVNLLGGDGMLAAARLVQSPPEGYTIMVAGVNTLVIGMLVQKAPYKAEDFTMLNLPSRDFTLMATSIDNAKLKSVEDVVKALQADPKSLSIGAQSVSPDNINLAMFARAIGVPMGALRLVTYEGGNGVRTAIMGGVIDIGLAGGEGFLPLTQLTRPLLVFDAKRREPFDAPCAGDMHFKEKLDFVPGTVRGFVLQSAFKVKYPDRYQIIVSAFEHAFKNPDAIAGMEKQKLDPTWYGPDDSNALYQAMFSQYQQHVDLLKGK
jgi:putative tricarboxylic transport membrane protein